MPPEIGPALVQRVLLALVVLLPLAALGLGAWLEPDPRGHGTHEQLGFRPCSAMETWGTPCPGCGVTTSVALAARGRLLASLRTQPFGLVALTSAALLAVWSVGRHRRGLDLAEELYLVRWRLWGLVLLALFLAAWAYKIGRVRGWY